METIVWWSAGGGSLNKEASWSPLFGGAQGGKSLNKEASWSPLFGGAQRGWKFKSRSFMETIVWWSAGGGKV